jgi:hypothetical protein
MKPLLSGPGVAAYPRPTRITRARKSTIHFHPRSPPRTLGLHTFSRQATPFDRRKTPDPTRLGALHGLHNLA